MQRLSAIKVQNRIEIAKNWLVLLQHGSVSVEWDGWRDADSGVESYTYTVYKMKKNDGGQIVEGDVVKESTTLSVLDAMPDVSVDEPGIY